MPAWWWQRAPQGGSDDAASYPVPGAIWPAEARVAAEPIVVPGSPVHALREALAHCPLDDQLSELRKEILRKSGGLLAGARNLLKTPARRPGAGTATCRPDASRGRDDPPAA